MRTVPLFSVIFFFVLAPTTGVVGAGQSGAFQWNTPNTHPYTGTPQEACRGLRLTEAQCGTFLQRLAEGSCERGEVGDGQIFARMLYTSSATHYARERVRANTRRWEAGVSRDALYCDLGGGWYVVRPEVCGNYALWVDPNFRAAVQPPPTVCPAGHAVVTLPAAPNRRIFGSEGSAPLDINGRRFATCDERCTWWARGGSPFGGGGRNRAPHGDIVYRMTRPVGWVIPGRDAVDLCLPAETPWSWCPEDGTNKPTTELYLPPGF